MSKEIEKKIASFEKNAKFRGLENHSITFRNYKLTFF